MDLIDRQDAIDALRTCYDTEAVTYTNGNEYISYDQALDLIETLPSAQQDCTECPEYDTERHYCPKYCDVIRRTLEEAKQKRTGRWIPCSERLPENIRPVIVTWKNNDPASYYQYIVGKHFTGTACYKNDKWYWYSSTTEDMLAEYGRYDSEEFDEAIECIAWMPLPEPYQEGES